MEYGCSCQIYTILLNWNGKHDTLECLDSLMACNFSGQHVVVVVDNASADGSQQAIRQRFPDVVLLQNDRNLGFAGGNNVGIGYALDQGADFVYLLNNDTVVDSGMLNALFEAAVEHPEAGIFGAKVYYHKNPNRIWYAGAEWSQKHAGLVIDGHDHEDDGKSWEELKPTGSASGCAMLIRSDVFRRIGLLDSRFFILWEEIDFCYHARRAGYACMFVPKAKLWHKVSSTFGAARSPRYLYFDWRHRLLWIERNLTLGDRIRIMPQLAREALTMFRWRYSPRAKPGPRMQARGALQGIRDYLFRRFDDCPSWLIPARNNDPSLVKTGGVE